MLLVGFTVMAKSLGLEALKAPTVSSGTAAYIPIILIVVIKFAASSFSSCIKAALSFISRIIGVLFAGRTCTLRLSY